MNQSPASRLPRHPRGPITVIPRVNPHQILQPGSVPPLEDSASRQSNENQEIYIEECKQIKMNKIQEIQDFIFEPEETIETNPKELLSLMHTELKESHNNEQKIQNVNHTQIQLESLKNELQAANLTIDELKSQIAEKDEIINQITNEQRRTKHKPKEPNRPHTAEMPGFSSNPRHYSPAKTTHIPKFNQNRQNEATD